jgi:hypothetical protein
MDYFTATLALIGVVLTYVCALYAKKQYDAYQRDKKEEKKEATPLKTAPLTKKPSSMQPFIAHPYPMQENFTGRDDERKMLSDWFEQGEKPMLALIAIGGMGKSSLAWKWVQDDVIAKEKTPEGLIWWSFYDRESSFDSFISRSLEYASGGEIKPGDIKSIRERMDKLYQILRERRFLLILDGVERLLRHYARLDAAYITHLTHL